MTSSLPAPRAVAVAILILALGLLQSDTASAQHDMKDMPGMPPKAPASKAVEESPDAAQKEMDAMPGMEPAKKPTKPASADSAQQEMDAMPGMTPKKPGAAGGMTNMPGMADVAAEPEPMSEPGIRILGPHQKWVPPAGEDRSAELLPRAVLEAHMKGLPEPVEDSMIHSFMLFDLLEYRAYNSGPATVNWDFVGWIGGDYNRLWIKSEGDWDLNGGNAVEGDVQLLYGRLIAPFWDFQIGVRQAFIGGSDRTDDSRTYAVIGFQGLAPGNFEIEPAIYISDRGNVSGNITASMDFYLTQKLVLQPRFEGQFSFQDDKQFGTASGVSQTDLGLRLRYEITREFAPYIGVSWLQKYGGTASIARSEGDSAGTLALVAGVRFWF